MGIELLKELSNADAIASNESEIREIIKKQIFGKNVEISFDGLGSMVALKKSSKENSKTIMFAAHMDEVGFMVRTITTEGLIFVTPIGGVLDKSKENQLVRITTETNQKIEGLMNVSRDVSGKIKDIYVDIGVETQEEVLKIGIDIGDMCTFSTEFRSLSKSSIYAGKAMDDRSACYVLLESLNLLNEQELPCNIAFAFTSSEEVGTRGGKLCSSLISPDVFFAVDVANHSELDRSAHNHRQIGQGPMLLYYDKTMIPNRKLLKKLQHIFLKNNIPYQKDMFKGGGTDAGSAHLENNGTMAAVLGIPLRYCHGPYSMVNEADIENMINLVNLISKEFTNELIDDLYIY